MVWSVAVKLLPDQVVLVWDSVLLCGLFEEEGKSAALSSNTISLYIAIHPIKYNRYCITNGLCLTFYDRGIEWCERYLQISSAG